MSKHIEMKEKQMHSFSAWIDYQIKHNDTFYRLFQKNS